MSPVKRQRPASTSALRVSVEAPRIGVRPARPDRSDSGATEVPESVESGTPGVTESVPTEVRDSGSTGLTEYGSPEVRESPVLEVPEPTGADPSGSGTSGLLSDARSSRLSESETPGTPESGSSELRIPVMPERDVAVEPESMTAGVPKSRSGAVPQTRAPEVPRSEVPGAGRSVQAGGARSSQPAVAQPGGGPRYLRMERVDARLRPDQVEALDREVRRLQRARNVRLERITTNTLLRVAVDLLLNQSERLAGDTEDALRKSLRLPDSGTSDVW